MPVRTVRPAALAAVAILALAGSAAAQRSAIMPRVTVEHPGHPDAVCNDGSKPVFYYHQGAGADRDKWVIYLQGGGGCASEPACMRRAENDPTLVSSRDMPATIIGDGIISTVPTVNPDFANYNHVFLHYCSSDAYAGDTARTIGGATWQFRGKEIVAAMIDQLKAPGAPGGPSLAAATDVLFAGGSAGAMGVHNNLDRVAAQLAPASVKGFADSGWMPQSLKPFGPGTFDVRPDHVAAMAFYGARPDDSCVAANSANPGRCLAQENAFPFIATPMFVYADQRDPALLAVLGILSAPTTRAEADYVVGYATATRESLRAAVPAFFAADTGRHTVLLTPRYTTVTAGPGSPTLGRVLHDWYFGGGGDGGSLQVVAPGPGSSP
jgi:hypothetical protein